MPKVKIDIKKFIEIRESVETKKELIEKSGYPEKTVDYLIHMCNQNGLKFSKRLKRSRNGINWSEAKEYLKSIQK